MAHLGQSFHCLAPDLPGFGDSRRGGAPKQPYTIDAVVASLAAYLATLNVRRVYFVGHALGAWVATRYALNHPEQVAGLVLLAPAGLQDEPWFARWRQRCRLLWPGMGSLLSALRPLASLLGLRRWLNRAVLLRRWLLASPMAASLLRRPRRDLWGEMLSPAQLAQLKPPLLLLHSEQDREIPLVLAQDFSQQVPGAKLCVVPGVSHVLQRDQPESVALWIREFIAQAEPAVAPPASPKIPNGGPVAVPGIGLAEDRPHP